MSSPANVLPSCHQFTGYSPQAVERLYLERRFRPLMREEPRLGSLVSYVGNRSVPLLRLYRYKEAFAFEFVRQFIRRFGLGEGAYVFDPFSGMGTTLFASMVEGIPSVGVDRLPIAAFAAAAIPKFLSVDGGALQDTYKSLAARVGEMEPAPVALDVPIMGLAFDQQTLYRLRKWKAAIDILADPLKDIFLLLFFSILEATSFTSKDGQFLRLKPDKRIADPDEALLHKVLEAEEDLERMRWLFPASSQVNGRLPRVFLGDTTELDGIPFERPPTAIITSPPYVNRYDYSRSYCLELCFHFVSNFQQLKAIRFGILRSHIESKLEPGEKPTHPVVQEVVEALASKKLNNPRIPHMLTAYFIDMGRAIREWSRVLAPGAQVALVVDNVRFEGELVPVDLILSEMAESGGFQVKEVIVARYKGNSSQQMKKYGRVPVRESVVVWRKSR